MMANKIVFVQLARTVCEMSSCIAARERDDREGESLFGPFSQRIDISLQQFESKAVELLCLRARNSNRTLKLAILRRMECKAVRAATGSALVLRRNSPL